MIYSKLIYVFLIVFIIMSVTMLFLFDFSLNNFIEKTRVKIDSLLDKILSDKDKKATLWSKNKTKRKHYELKKYINKEQLKKAIKLFILLFIILVFMQKSILMIPIVYSVVVLSDVAYMKHNHNKRRELLKDLQISLSLINTSYNYNTSIKECVQENLEYFSGDIKEAFTLFVNYCDYVSPNISENLDRIKPMVDHYLWEDWIIAVKDSLKSTNKKIQLNDVLHEISALRDTESFVDSEINKNLQDFNMSVMMCVGGMLVIPMIFEGGASALLNTQIGNISIAIASCMILLAYHNVNQIINSDLFKKKRGDN